MGRVRALDWTSHLGLGLSNLCGAQVLGGQNSAATASATEALPLMWASEWGYLLADPLALLAAREGRSESPCSGYYILKNNDKSFAIFKEWYSIDTQESEYFNLNHCYEQWGVYRMFESKRKEELLMINDDMFLDSHAGQFLRHIATPQDRKRIPFFKGKIRELSLLKHLVLRGI